MTFDRRHGRTDMGMDGPSRTPRDASAIGDRTTAVLVRWWRLVSSGALIAIAAAWTVGLLGFVLRTVRGTYEIVDFHTYYLAAQAVLHGHDPYPGLDDPSLTANVAYIYPPLTAIATIPLTLLPVAPAGALVVVALTAAVLVTLRVLGVRDWRCYVLVLCWRPVLFGILTGNVTIFLGLAAAFGWRFRDRALPAAASVGAAIATKVFVWPLVVWLVATRRYRAALLSCGTGVALLVGPWAAIGFAGLTSYPNVLRKAEELQERSTYTIHALAVDLGASPSAARAVGVAVVAALLAGVLLLGRRGDDRGAFVLAIAAAIAFSPIVWLHYFALLIVVVAVAQPRLGPLWLIPLAMWAVPGAGGTATQNAATLVGAALVVLLAARPRPFHREVGAGPLEHVHAPPRGSPA